MRVLPVAAADGDDDGDDAANETEQQRDSSCRYSDWTEWSPCSKTCGSDAVQERQRRLLPPSELQQRTAATCGATLRLRRRICSNLPSCDAASTVSLQFHTRDGRTEPVM